MEMTFPITLIVKAPNQQIEDQTVKCELSWTIKKLKSHLSEVYPSKPARDEQKLIYSGQLLSDSVVLKDVLRNYDEQDTHTVHLVCTSSRNYQYETPKVKPDKQMDQPTQSLPSEPSPSSSSSGLRQRPVNLNQQTMTNTNDNQAMWTALFNSAHTLQYVDPSQYAMQFALFQQAYAQYINQYMQMVTNQVPQVQTEVQQETEPPAAVPETNRHEAVEENENEDAPADRDWVDWFYMFSRLLVISCLVYFYSSPLRFASVVLLGVGLYLYQIGFFRAQNEFRRYENNNIASANGNGDNDNIPEERPTILHIIWTFFSAFFASLIPEIPNPV